jgi:hypothetical protein
MQQSFEIRGRTLGLSGPCFVIGEAGRNHNGSFGQALALLDVAAEAGCDAVEFQAMELPEDWLPRLRACADEHDLALIVSLRHEGPSSASTPTSTPSRSTPSRRSCARSPAAASR